MESLTHIIYSYLSGRDSLNTSNAVSRCHRMNLSQIRTTVSNAYGKNHHVPRHPCTFNEFVILQWLGSFQQIPSLENQCFRNSSRPIAHMDPLSRTATTMWSPSLWSGVSSQYFIEAFWIRWLIHSALCFVPSAGSRTKMNSKTLGLSHLPMSCVPKARTPFCAAT